MHKTVPTTHVLIFPDYNPLVQQASHSLHNILSFYLRLGVRFAHSKSDRQTDRQNLLNEHNYTYTGKI